MTPRPTGRTGWTVVLALAGATVACSAGGSPPAHHRLDIRDLAFQPGTLDVAPGDTVSWTNHDIVPHTVTWAAGARDSGRLDPGQAFVAVVAAGDTVHYTCLYHPTMTGTLVVRP